MTKYVTKQEEKNSPLAFFFLVLYTISVFIRPHEIFPVSEQWIFIKVFAILSILAMLVAQRPLKLFPQHWLLLGLLPVIMFSAFFNGYGMNGFTQSQVMLVGSILPMMLYSFLVTTIKRTHIIMMISLVAAMCMVHNGYIQQTGDFFGWTNRKCMTQSCRITYMGFFNDPNDVGMFLVMNIPFATYFLSQKKFVGKVIFLTILIALFYGIHMTGSRGTLLGGVGLIGVYLLLTKGGTKVILFSIVFAPIIATLIAARGGLSSSEASAEGRLDAWFSGIHEMLLANPFFGIGMGNFVDWHGRTAHNSFVLIAGELGGLGLSLWGGTLFLTILSGYYLVKKYKSLKCQTEITESTIELKKELLLASVLFYSMIGYVLTAFFLSRTYTLLLFIFLGLNIASHVRILKIDKNFHQQLSIKAIKNAILVSWAMLTLVYITLKLT